MALGTVVIPPSPALGDPGTKEGCFLAVSQFSPGNLFSAPEGLPLGTHFSGDTTIWTLTHWCAGGPGCSCVSGEVSPQRGFHQLRPWSPALVREPLPPGRRVSDCPGRGGGDGSRTPRAPGALQVRGPHHWLPLDGPELISSSGTLSFDLGPPHSCPPPRRALTSSTAIRDLRAWAQRPCGPICTRDASSCFSAPAQAGAS